MPRQSTIYHYDEVELERVEVKNPDSYWERVSIRVHQTYGAPGDTVDFQLSFHHAQKLAWALFDAMGIDPTKSIAK